MAPPWSPWFRSGSVIDRRSTAENCQNRGPWRWHGVNFEHVQTSAVPPRVGPIRSGIAAAPPWPPWHRIRTAVAPPSPPCLRSTTAVQSRKSRLATPTAIPWRFYCGYGGATTVLPRCYHGSTAGMGVSLRSQGGILKKIGDLTAVPLRSYGGAGGVIEVLVRQWRFHWGCTDVLTRWAYFVV